jgi:hypothetical protein
MGKSKPRRSSISYFKGSPEEWRTEMPTYSRIVYPSLWEGIDLVYSGTTNRLKYEFVAQPGADPARIRLSYRGATVGVNQAGQLEVSTPAGGFYDDAPIAYQEVEGRRQPVEVSFTLDQASWSSAEQSYPFGFHLGIYDHSLPLVIDPAVIVYCGFIGGSSDDGGYGISVDSAGTAYITGNTSSTEATFPEAVGPDTNFNGSLDAFVAKVKADGTGLVYASYIGGDSFDTGYGIAVDSTGNAYVTGWTMSTETTFPVIVVPDPSHNGGQDAFVAKVNPDGTGLVYAGFIGGGGYDWGNGIAVDATGNAYIAGETDSTEATFPKIVGPDLTYNGNDDAFVVKVNADGMSLAYAGYIGGNGSEYGNGIAVDTVGNAYITGYTTSTEASFPVSVGPDHTYNGGSDAFVVEVNATGIWLVYAGYIGGSSDDKGYGIAMDTSGNAYVAGLTYSTEASFPETVGPDLTHNGGIDAFVAKVNATGAGLVYAGYIGGSSDDKGNAIAVDTAGNAYVTGGTYSTEETFPEIVGPDLTHNSGSDAFVAKVNTNGATLVYAGYIGGSGDEEGCGIAVDTAGNAYITGETQSTEATFPETVGPDLAHNGSNDAFVVLVSTISVYLPLVLR